MEILSEQQVLNYNDLSGTPKIAKNDVCVYCNSDDYVNCGGNLICKQCNHIQNTINCIGDSNIDISCIETDRCGIATDHLFPESAHATYISNNRNGRMSKLSKLQISMSIPYTERSKRKKFDEITNRVKGHGVSNDIVRDAHELYNVFLIANKQHGKTEIARGLNIIEHLSGALFYAFKNAGQTRNYAEIGKIMDLDQSRVTNGVKTFFSITSRDKKIDHKITCYSDFITRFCNKLGLNHEVIEMVTHVSDKAHELNILINNNPSSIVAGCIFFVTNIMCDYNLTKATVASHCGLSSVTVNKIYNKLLSNIELLV